MDCIFPPLPTAVWLRGRTVGLRAPVRADAGEVNVWYGGDPPLTPDEAETLLATEERVPWGHNPVMRLMIVTLSDGNVLGSVVVHRSQRRTSRLELAVGTRRCHREDVQREVLCIVIPWLLSEVALMTVTIRIASDDEPLIEAALQAGMKEAVRLREAVARPDGRVDLLIVERVNEQWGRRLERNAHEGHSIQG